ncbi:MAG TPA: hypothetical protein VGR90_02575, partial [Acidimicrobiales bacterium]|nr:hypothetical protein [Acidimicrobiales bacterium]
MARGWGRFWRDRPEAGDTSSPLGEGQEIPTAPVRSDSFTIGAARPARRGLWTAVVAGLVVLAAVLSAVVLSSNKTNNS